LRCGKFFKLFAALSGDVQGFSARPLTWYKIVYM
jgi:hypothetical protein